MTTVADDADAHAETAVHTLFRADRLAQGLDIEILSVKPGRVVLAMTVRADMQNGHGKCHGGVIFALADCAFAYACNSREGAMTGASSNIEFINPCRAGARLTASASEISRGERYGIYDVAVTDGDGLLVAHFRGRCARMRVPAPTA